MQRIAHSRKWKQKYSTEFVQMLRSWCSNVKALTPSSHCIMSPCSSAGYNRNPFSLRQRKGRVPTPSRDNVPPIMWSSHIRGNHGSGAGSLGRGGGWGLHDHDDDDANKTSWGRPGLQPRSAEKVPMDSYQRSVASAIQMILVFQLCLRSIQESDFSHSSMKQPILLKSLKKS